MKKNLLRVAGIFFLSLFSHALLSQSLQPFEGCPGVSVAITRPGFNASPAPFQIYLIDDTTGAVTATGAPINLQINGFGLNAADGYLYGMHQSYNVANPYLARVGSNGAYRNVGRLKRPNVGPDKLAIINTAAGTTDDADNYYFTAVVIDLQNILLAPRLYVGKVRNLSQLDEGNGSLDVQYREVEPGTCMEEFLASFQDPLNGVMQDIAFNPSDKHIYTYLPGPGGTPGKLAHFNLVGDPVFECMETPQPNPGTAELSGLFFTPDSTLMILTTDGNLYLGDIHNGSITSVAQSVLPLISGNLRGDMASCLGARSLVPFDDCPGAAVAVTRPGINSTGGPHQIYLIEPETGATTAVGAPLNLQINGFGLNTRDGFLYGLHEVTDIYGPTFTRVDRMGGHVDIGILNPPPGNGNRIGIINTAAGTIDAHDNYYFMAIEADTNNITELPRLYIGIISRVSQLEPGEEIAVEYKRVYLGSCIDELLLAFLNNADGAFQDLAYNPQDNRLYSYLQTGASPARGKLVSINPRRMNPVLECITPNQPNPLTQDMSGIHSATNGKLYILTIDGKYYRGNPNNGRITLIDQTDLPLLGDNLRGDLASCVKRNGHHHREGEELETERGPLQQPEYLRLAPNPVTGSEMSVYVNADLQTNAELRVVDASGNTVHARRITLVEGDNQVRLNLPDLRRGTYALTINFPGGRSRSSKFIRQ